MTRKERFDSVLGKGPAKRLILEYDDGSRVIIDRDDAESDSDGIMVFIEVEDGLILQGKSDSHMLYHMMDAINEKLVERPDGFEPFIRMARKMANTLESLEEDAKVDALELH